MLTRLHSLYRSQTLMESVTPGYADNTIATTGLQNISYDLSGNLSELRRRDDRVYSLSEYWYFGKPTLAEQNVSLVTTSDYSCYVVGVRVIQGNARPSLTFHRMRESTNRQSRRAAIKIVRNGSRIRTLD